MLFFSYKVKGEYTKLYYMTVKAHFNQQLNDRCVNLTSVIALNWYVSIICLLFLCYAKSPTTEIPAGRNSMDACVPIFSFFYQLPFLSLIIRHSMFTISTSNSWSYSCQSLHCRAAHLLLAWFHSTFHNTDTKKCYFYPWTSHSPGSEKKCHSTSSKCVFVLNHFPKQHQNGLCFHLFTNMLRGINMWYERAVFWHRPLETSKIWLAVHWSDQNQSVCWKKKRETCEQGDNGRP